MSAPSNFDPQPRDPGARPPPMPPRYLKHQIYTDPRVFKHIDDHAINEARTNYRNFRDLIWNLIYKKNFNELEKTRAIFRWMTTKNMYTIMFDSELPGSPEAIIGGFKDGKTTYARIFECLCSYAGMYCVTLSGWAKGVDYRPGQPITSGPINHSWNCVHIDGNWQLVDSHWATRYLQSERNTPENLVYEYDDFYFIPVPANLIYSHMPEDPAWQALYPAQSRAEYEDHPLVKSFFFNIGMQFTQQKQGVMYTKKGILVVTLGFTRPAAFTFKLGYGDAMVESVKGIQLKRYIIQETSQNHVSFYFRAPREGNYYLTVFAQHVSDRIKLENVFKAVCEYKFVCEQAAGDIRPYPQCSDSNWGPGAPVRQYGLIPNHTEAILLAPNGRAEVAFQKTRDVRLYARLAKDGMDEDTLERSVAVREQDNQIFITVHLPTRGEYGLEIYANEPSKEGDTFTHMCQYLASFIERDPSQMYGQVYDRADLTLQPSSTGPLMYSGTTSEYAASPAEIQRLAPNRQYGGVLPESAMQQQYDAQQSLNWPNRGPSGQWQNQGPHYAGAPGQGQQYSPGQQQYRQPGGPGGQQYDQNQQYGGPGSGPMGQYQGGSQQYGPGGKQGPEYGAPPASPGHDLMSRTETTAVGSGKKPPPTAPKPRRGGQEDDQLPPPPPDMMDQQYNQHAQPAQDDLPPPPPELLSGPGQSGANRRPPPGGYGSQYPHDGYSSLGRRAPGTTPRDGPDTAYGSSQYPHGYSSMGRDGYASLGRDGYASLGRDGYPTSQGRDGYPSSQGRDGYPTSQGRDGYPTSQGRDGYPTSQGRDGYPSSQGRDGYPTSQGRDGYPTSQGRDGYPTSQGRDGYPISQGRDGYPTSQGRDGYSSLGRPTGTPDSSLDGRQYSYPDSYSSLGRPAPATPSSPGGNTSPYGSQYPDSSLDRSPPYGGRKPQGSTPEEPKEPPIEIVYVPSGKPGKTDRGDPQKGGQGPVEIVYVGGSKGTLGRKDGSNEKLAPGQRSPGQGSGSGSTDRLHPTQEWDGTGVRPSSQSPNHLSSYSTDMASSPQDMERNGPSSKESPSAGHKGGSPRYAVLAGSRTPSGASDGRSPYGDQYDRDRQHRGEPVEGGTYHFGAPDSAQNEFGYANRPTEPEREYQPQDKLYTTSITIEPPKDFKPKPVQHQEAPKPLPPSVPPKPFKDTKVFSKVDSHAVEVSKEEHKNFRELVWHLIYAREITNDLEKARAIFLWLCSKDLAKLNFDNVPKGSPEEILMNLQRGQTTYAVVYETLCRYAGLHCQTISGYAKGAEYKPGMQFTGEQGQHSWNAVLVEGAWRLVDCHWAARRLVGKKVTAENVRYELDEYYFMPDPHQLIFTHFPDNTSWQLLERSISLSDFENLVPVKSAFFKYGLQILSHKEAVIRTTREVTIRIGCPPFKSQSLAFTFTLSYDDGKEEYHGTKLNRYGMQELLDNVSFFTIRPPEKGSYRLILYAKDLTQASKEGVYGGVCEYEVISESASVKPQPFPPCVHTSWGPGDSAHKYSLTPLQKGAIFSTVNGQAELKFNIPKELRFTAKLKSNEQDEKALQGFIMHRVVNDVAVFTITAPSPGEFGLEIYANDPEVDGNSLYHAFQYLIICSEVKGPVEALPVLPPGYLGPQPTFKKLGLNTISHNDPYLQTDCGDLEIIFSLGQPLRMTSQLIYVSQNKNEDFSDYLLQQGRGGNNVAFSIKLPKTGMYKFQVYALPFSDTSESLPGVYNYLINCRMTQATLLPFPKQYGQWKEGCYLHEPLDGQLQANRPIKGNASSFEYIYFKVDVPKANSVAIVVGDDWTQLEQKNNGPWEGEVFMEKHWGKESKAALCANYGTVKASYSTLLEYTL